MRLAGLVILAAVLAAADPTTSPVPATRALLEAAQVPWATPGLHRHQTWVVSTVAITGGADEIDIGQALAQTTAADRLTTAAIAALWPDAPAQLGELWPAVSARLPVRLATLDLDAAHERKPPVVALAVNLAGLQAAQILGGAGDLAVWCRARLDDPLLAEAAVRLASPDDLALRALLAGKHVDAAGRPRLAALARLAACTPTGLNAYAQGSAATGDAREAAEAQAVAAALPAAPDAWTPWLCGLGLVKAGSGRAAIDNDTLAFALGEDAHLAPDSAQTAADWLKLADGAPPVRALVCARRAVALGGGAPAIARWRQAAAAMGIK